MFKIVQTIEKGLEQLTIVPGGWVENNKLAWPKMGADKLIKNPNSIPESNWFMMPCKLKRNHLISYEIAEEELERMLENDDTEQEQIEIIQTKKRPRIIFQKNKSDAQNDFNSLANECLIIDTPMQRDESLNVLPSEVISLSNVVNTDPSITYQILPPSNNDVVQYSSFFETQQAISDLQISQKLDKIIANQEIIMERQQAVIENFEHLASCPENQLKIMQQLAKLEVMLDSVASKTSNNTSSCSNTNQSSSLETKDDIFFDLVDTSLKLQELEAKLANQTNMEEHIKKFSYVCGRKGSCSGMNNCYTLVDKLFSRKLFTLCSWAGGARDGKEKIPFKMFKNIINLFFRVVRLSDNSFTLKDCEAFFKGVIRNSTKRSESNMIRSSVKRRRPSSLSYKSRKEKLQIHNITEKTIEGNLREVESKNSNNNTFAEENYDTLSGVSNDEKDEETK